jgi:hypothetical protein
MDKELQEWYNLHKFHFYSGSYETKDLANFLGVSPKPNKEQLTQINKYLAQKELKDSL